MTEGTYDIRTGKRIPDGHVTAQGFAVSHDPEDIEAALDVIKEQTEHD